jgi:hypothetical protein
VIDVQAEIEQLWGPLLSSLQMTNWIQIELRQLQLDRQHDIWMQIVSLLFTRFHYIVALS